MFFLWRRTGSAMTSSPSEIVTQNGSLDSQAVQALLETVQREIAACTLCVEAGFIPLSRPVFQGRGAAADDRGASTWAVVRAARCPLHRSDRKDAATVARASGVSARDAASRLLPDQPHQVLPGSGHWPRWKRRSPAVCQGDRALRAASGLGDRAGAARDRRLVGAAGRGAPRSDGARITPWSIWWGASVRLNARGTPFGFSLCHIPPVSRAG